MARSENFLWKKVSGALGKQIVFKQYGDRTVIAKYPDMSGRTLSDKQREVNDMMERANSEAKRILGDDRLKIEAQARLNVTRNKLYTSLISEYFRNAKAKEDATGDKDLHA